MHEAWDALLVRVYEDLLFVRIKVEVVRTVSIREGRLADQGERILALEMHLAAALEAILYLQPRACAADPLSGEFAALKRARNLLPRASAYWLHWPPTSGLCLLATLERFVVYCS